MKRRSFAIAVPLLGLASAPRAQAFPTKPLRYIVPVVAGGGSDMIARTVTERWARALGQTIVVDNQGGGGGVIACTTTLHSPNDGYTLLQGYVATHGTSPATRKVPYDPVADFTPVGMIGGTPNVLVVNPNIAVNDFGQFIAYLKANPEKASYGSAGAGSLTHLTMELLKSRTGTQMTHVPYKGVAPAFTDLIGNQTQAMFPGLAAAMPHIKSGRVKPIAVTGSARHPQAKDVPTLDELGLAGFDAMQWYGVVGPAGMPASVVNRLNETLNAVLNAPDLSERLSVEAVQPMPMSARQFGDYVKADFARWSKLARDQHIELES